MPGAPNARPCVFVARRVIDARNAFHAFSDARTRFCAVS
jgi:hypothetical protein